MIIIIITVIIIIDNHLAESEVNIAVKYCYCRQQYLAQPEVNNNIVLVQVVFKENYRNPRATGQVRSQFRSQATGQVTGHTQKNNRTLDKTVLH